MTLCFVNSFATSGNFYHSLMNFANSFDPASNIFLFLFSNEMLVFMAGIHKMVVRTANQEDPDQTASLEAV